MFSESDYEDLRKQYPRFLVFHICSKHPEAKEWVVNVQSRRRVISLAQELIAIDNGVQADTVKRDWKLHKPECHRQTR
jgi:hypothetical protein